MSDPVLIQIACDVLREPETSLLTPMCCNYLRTLIERRLAPENMTEFVLHSLWENCKTIEKEIAPDHDLNIKELAQ